MPRKRKAVDAGSSEAPPAPSVTKSLRPRIPRTTTPAEPSDARPSAKAPKAMSSKPKRTSGRAAKKDRWGEDYLVTNPESPLAYADLVKLFSSPEAWTCLDESEKREILSLLPAHVHPNPDPDPDNPDAKIPPLPENFLRYDNHWRYGLRQWQVDLEAGRLDPKWQRQAAQAVKERAEGKFDKFKEQQFEQFWGQKQKIDYRLTAGESSKVKLETLIEHGVIRVGDVWKHSRSFRKTAPGEHILVEKEAKILAIDGSTLTFTVPAGQRVFLSGTHDFDSHGGTSKEENPNDTPTEDTPKDDPETTEMKAETPTNGAEDHAPCVEMNDTEAPEPIAVNGDASHGREDDLQTQQELKEKDDASEGPVAESPHETLTLDESTTPKKRRGRPRKRVKISDDSSIDVAVVVPKPSSKFENNFTPPETESDFKPPLDSAPKPSEEIAPDLNIASFAASVTEAAKPIPVTIEPPSTYSPLLIPSGSSQEDGPSSKSSSGTTPSPPPPGPEAEAKTEELLSSTTTDTPRDIVIRNIAGPGALAKKILEVDGRMTNPPNGNSWKVFRCYRDNQDMGSLWEVRQAWFVKVTN